MIPANVSNNQAVRIVGLSGKKDIYNADFSRERLGEYNKCETNWNREKRIQRFDIPCWYVTYLDLSGLV